MKPLQSRGEALRDFPLLNRQVSGKPLVLLSSTNYTPIPTSTLEMLQKAASFSMLDNLEKADEIRWSQTKAVKPSRKKIAEFIGGNHDEIVFTHNSTLSAFLLLNRIADAHLKQGDEVIISSHEYASTFLSLRELAKKKGIKIKRLSIKKDHVFDEEEFDSMLNDRVKLICVVQASSFTGSVTNVKRLCEKARRYNAITVIDASYSVPHMPINVKELDCDFLYFSSYKLYTPPGVGVIYGKKAKWQELKPLVPGAPLQIYSYTASEMRETQVQSEPGISHNYLIHALAASIDYINQKGGVEAISQIERALHKYAKNKLLNIPGLTILDESDGHLSSIPFIIDGYSSDKIYSELSNKGILIKVMDQTSVPVEFLNKYGVKKYAKISFGMYNSKYDVDKLVEELYDIVRPSRQPVEPLKGGELEVRRLTPPLLSDDHIGTREMALRPFRKKGPRVEFEQAGRKKVIQHYGHGGAGWSISPATTQEVMDILREIEIAQDQPITIIGSGIVGLMSAMFLTQAGFKHLTIITENIAQTTSHIASAHFSPGYFALNTAYVDPELAKRRSNVSYEFWTSVMKGHPAIKGGVRRVPCYMHEEKPTMGAKGTPTEDLFKPKRVLVDFGTVKREMWAVDNYLGFEARDILTHLREYLVEHNVKWKHKKINNLDEVEDDVIVNCAGLGSQDLIQDKSMIPTLGKHVYLKNQAGRNLDYVIWGEFGPGDRNSIEFIAKRSPEGRSAYDIGLLGSLHIPNPGPIEDYEGEYEQIVARMRHFFNQYN